jgi:serine/threonine-protein kinase
VPTDHTDRNLLFGVLALQADILDGQQFVAACSEWASRKATPLADVLAERGWLTPEERTLVDQLLERKLKKHDEDAHASLAAVTTPEVRSVLESVADPDVQQSLVDLPTPARPSILSTVAYQPDARQRYTLTRLHAKGGIGQVWLAHDEDLSRDVALKELRPDRRDNPAARARFLDEARITGQLEHPGIVPVYELVQPREGEPCYAMRFVGGRTLADAIRDYHRRRQAGEAGALDLRELLTGFVSVCNAVGYAHSRGVLHRDLKPANVALGDFGEVLVLDWGLAKVVGKDEEPTSLLPVSVGQAEDRGETRQGQVLGTPAYMPPEQARGRVDLVDRRSDVYGLGAILYEVLTGEPPFSGADAPDVVRQVTQQPVVPPRQRVPATPPALQALCLKALAKEPGDRYESARELARDVERWLADEPVLAYREPLRDRVRRWGRRHRQLTTGLTVLLLTGLVGLGAGLWAVRAEQVQTLAEKRQAEENLKLAKQAVDHCFELAKDHPVLQQENMRQVRKLLLEKALPFYEQFRVRGQDDPQIRAEMADNHFRVGYITSEIGRSADAQQSYAEASRLLEQLAKEHPEVTKYQADLAGTCNNLGILQQRSGQRAEAERSYGEARRLYEPLASEHPDVPTYQADLAGTCTNLGGLQRESGRRAEAERSYAEARRLWEPLAREHPEVTRYQVGLARTSYNLGILQQGSGRRAEAERSYAEVRRLYEPLAREHPEVTEYQAELATTHNNLGILQRESGRRVEAEQSFAEARRLLEPLAREHPEVTHYPADLAATYVNLGNLQQESGRRAEAERSYAQARRLLEPLTREHPEVTQYQADLARSHHNLGNLQRESGRGAEAERSYGEARRLYEPLARQHPEVTEYQAELAKNFTNLGALQWGSGRRAEAERSYRDALRLLEPLAREHPEITECQSDLATTYNNLGGLQQETGRRAEAERSYADALRLREALAREHPDVPFYRANLGGTYVNLGNLQTDSGQPRAALDWYAKAIEALQAVLSGDPNNAMARLYLKNAHWGRAQTLARLDRHAEAAQDWGRALELDDGPARLFFRLQRALSLARAGDHAQAVAEANAVAGLQGVPAPGLYDLACVCALASAAVKGDAKLADRYAARAVELLRQAVAKGYRDVEHVQKDPDLGLLRGREDFQKQLKDLEAKPKAPK